MPEARVDEEVVVRGVRIEADLGLATPGPDLGEDRSDVAPVEPLDFGGGHRSIDPVRVGRLQELLAEDLAPFMRDGNLSLLPSGDK